MIKINRTKVEDIVKDRLRSERAPMLAELDIEYTRSIENGRKSAEVAKKKQQLRDVTDKDFSQLSIEQLAELTLEQALSL